MTADAATFCATLVDEWVRSGVTDAVISPGSRSTPLVVSLASRAEMRLHVHPDERSAGFMALGLGIASGLPAIVVCTSGTAAAHLHAAVIEADLAAVPMIVCTADRPPELRDRFAPQTIDQTNLYGRSVRWFHDPGVPDAAVSSTWRSLASRTVLDATGTPPGPVHLNLPFREPLVGEPGELPPGRPDGRAWTEEQRSERSRVDLPAELAVPHGVVVAGASTHEPDEIHAFAAHLGWPVLADPRSGCRRPGLGAVAHADAFLRVADIADELRPDVVLRVGDLPASRVVNEWLAASDAEDVLVDVRRRDPAATASLVLDQLPTIRQTSVDRAWHARWREIDDAAAAAITSVVTDEPLSEPGIARRVVAAAPAGASLVVASSMPVRDVEWYSEPRTGLRVLANRGANGIDGIVSTAVGVALTGAPTVALLGDLAFLHDSNGLTGLADRAVDLSIVVVDNGGGGIFSFLPQHEVLSPERFEQLFGTPHGADLQSLGAAYGIEARTLETPDDLDAFVSKPSGARVGVVRSDRAANLEVHRRINTAVADAVANLS